MFVGESVAEVELLSSGIGGAGADPSKFTRLQVFESHVKLSHE
jgi:hypothetical protein